MNTQKQKKDIRKEKGLIERRVVLSSKINKNYIKYKLSDHALKAFNDMDILKQKPIFLLLHMGIDIKRFRKIINQETDILLSEAVAYYDYMKEKGKINSMDELFERL